MVDNSNTKLKLSLKPTVCLNFFQEAELLWEWFEVHGANLQGHCWKITGLKRHLESTVVLHIHRFKLHKQDQVAFLSLAPSNNTSHRALRPATKHLPQMQKANARIC